MYNIILTGTLEDMTYFIVRNYCDCVLSQIPIPKDQIEIHAFGRTKVRKIAERHSFERGYHCVFHEPEWQSLGRSAGFRLIENLVVTCNALILFDSCKTPMLTYMEEQARDWCLDVYKFDKNNLKI